MRTIVVSILAVAGLVSCAAQEPPAEASVPAVAPAMPGADRDAHGCIASAGYAWCESTGRCERPWELAKEKSFDNSTEAFAQYCKNPVK